MAELPEFVYLVTAEQDGAVSAIADDEPDAADRIEEEIARRQRASAHGIGRAFFRVWRVPVREAVEMEVVPREVTLRVKAAGARVAEERGAAVTGRPNPAYLAALNEAAVHCATMLRNQGPCELIDGEWAYERTVGEVLADLHAAGHFLPPGTQAPEAVSG